MKFTIALIFSTSFLCVSGQSQTNSTISVVDTNLATKITVSGFCLCRTSLPDLEKLVPALKSVHVEEIDLPENCFGQDGRFENGKGYSSEKYPGITDDTTVLISFIAKFDERKATKDGYYLGGYVVNIDNAQAKLIDSGLWIIKNERELVLTSQKHTLAFQLIKYDTYLFFLLPGQKDKFIYDLTQLKKELKNETSVQTENRTLGIEDFIAKRLLEKYYGRDLYFDAGT